MKQLYVVIGQSKDGEIESHEVKGTNRFDAQIAFNEIVGNPLGDIVYIDNVWGPYERPEPRISAGGWLQGR